MKTFLSLVVLLIVLAILGSPMWLLAVGVVKGVQQ
ncbi:hypothetical protein CH06BL_09830 [Chromobacterium haemolyticum]|nr:hypothetical protein CH06BL_09830 [Chromobacterium haemolyticum]